LNHARIALVVLAAAPFCAQLACGSSSDATAEPDPPGSGTAVPTGTPTNTPTSTATPSPTGTALPDGGDGGNTAAATAFHVGGTILNAAQAGLVLQNNAGADLTIAPGTTAFQFPIKVAIGGGYAVSIKTAPGQQACRVVAGMGTIVSADVASVVVDCNNRASCKALKADFPTAASGSYLVDVDGAGALAPLVAYCDMTFDDGAGGGAGGWTLIESTAGGLGPSGLTEGPVAPGSSAHLPLATMVALADGASQVHLRSTGLAATESVTSKPDMEPIVDLRAGIVINASMLGLTPAQQVDRFTGPFANAARLEFGCAASTATWPSLYWGCNNTQGLHLVSTHSRWNWLNGDVAQNVAMEAYVR